MQGHATTIICDEAIAEYQAETNRWRRVAAICVARLGGLVVIDDDELMPCILVNGPRFETTAYALVTGKDLGASFRDEPPSDCFPVPPLPMSH